MTHLSSFSSCDFLTSVQYLAQSTSVISYLPPMLVVKLSGYSGVCLIYKQNTIQFMVYVPPPFRFYKIIVLLHKKPNELGKLLILLLLYQCR